EGLRNGEPLDDHLIEQGVLVEAGIDDANERRIRRRRAGGGQFADREGRWVAISQIRQWRQIQARDLGPFEERAQGPPTDPETDKREAGGADERLADALCTKALGILSEREGPQLAVTRCACVP